MLEQDNNKSFIVLETQIHDSHKKTLLESHLSLQKVASKVALPITFVLFLITLIVDPCWQNAVILGAFVITAICWFAALRLTKKGQLYRSVIIFTSSVILLEMIIALVMDGNDASALLGCVIMIIYTSLFSKKVFLFTTAGTLAAYLIGIIFNHLDLFEQKLLSPLNLMLYNGAFTALLLALTAIVLRRSNLIKDALLKQMTIMNNRQSSVITTASEVSILLHDVIFQLEEFSLTFAAQTAQQATAITEANVAMEQIRRIAGDTAQSAAGTRSAAEQTQKKSVLSSRRLKIAESGFDKVVLSVEEAVKSFGTLAEEAENIGDVLRTNRNIAAQIKILAVNAGIQAAKAGEAGSGFNVVSKELKSMIQKTDTSLAHSRTLLERIRTNARQSADTIRTSTGLLKSQLLELNSAGELIEDITNSFIDTASQFNRISDAAKEQQSRLQEVSSGMNQIDISAEELNKRSTVLVESVRKLSTSETNLRKIFQTIKE